MRDRAHTAFMMPSEMRLNWLASVQHVEGEEGPPYGTWTSATQDNRYLFEIIRESLNKVHGPQTHWVEVRTAPPADFLIYGTHKTAQQR